MPNMAIVMAPLPRLTPFGPFPKLVPQSQERVYIMQAPTLRDVYEAKKTIAHYLPRTPLQHSPGLSRIRRAMGVLIEEDHTLAGGAGAAALAGAIRCPELVRGKKVSVTVNGANTTLPQPLGAVKVYQVRH